MAWNKTPSGVNVVVLGEAGVGKTCFTDMFLKGETFVYYDPLDDEAQRLLHVDGKEHSIRPMDVSSTMLRDPDPALSTTVFHLSFANAQGIFLLYDVTSRATFDLITRDAYLYALTARQSMSTGSEHWGKRCGFVLVGNKADVVRDEPDKREVETEMAAEWARSQGFEHVEVTSTERAHVDGAMAMLVQNIELAKRRDKKDQVTDEVEAKSTNRKDRVSFRSRLKSTVEKLS